MQKRQAKLSTAKKKQQIFEGSNYKAKKKSSQSGRFFYSILAI